ncbi:hypothetical protein MHH60_22635 [Paenibacillus sp. FSL H7-0716]|uniref:DUF5668 domain-containing protein n=1 Tax=Paenibacillus odorifer TaxID=189426 RepID=A0AB36JC05_9BACL|nr:hypothetical protein [Paenibacillus odorifer]OME13310.1 hypothetical protein BSK60_15850 [Paenibacillus odorifer]OME16771.1 hypothetical protein BSK47_19545 [Paenibacillus odorifer]
MSSKKDIQLGIFIVAAGIVILLGKLGVFGYLGRALWPLVILIPGIVLHMLFFSRRASASVLVPAGILTVYGLLFGLCNIWGWGLMRSLWPVLLLGLAVGLYEYSIYEPRRTGGLSAIAVTLGLLSLALCIFSLMGTGAIYLIGIVLIAVGIWLITGRGRVRGRNRWYRS